MSLQRLLNREALASSPNRSPVASQAVDVPIDRAACRERDRVRQRCRGVRRIDGPARSPIGIQDCQRVLDDARVTSPDELELRCRYGDSVGRRDYRKRVRRRSGRPFGSHAILERRRRSKEDDDKDRCRDGGEKRDPAIAARGRGGRVREALCGHELRAASRAVRDMCLHRRPCPGREASVDVPGENLRREMAWRGGLVRHERRAAARFESGAHNVNDTDPKVLFPRVNHLGYGTALSTPRAANRRRRWPSTRLRRLYT